MKSILLLTIFLLITACSGSKLISVASDGYVSKTDYNEEFDFRYIKGHIYVEVEIDGSKHTFLFDTGYDISMLDEGIASGLDFKPVKKFKTSGSSFETTYLQYGFLESLRLDKLTYKDIGIGIQDLSMIDSPFDDGRKVVGVIGANILRKSFWQIDYERQILRYSSSMKDLEVKEEAGRIQLHSKNSSQWGLCRLELEVDGYTDLFVFDTGSSGGITINNDFLQDLSTHNSRTYVDFNPSGSIGRKQFEVGEVKMGNLSLEKKTIGVEKVEDNLLGNQVLDDYLVTINWKEGVLYLEER